MSAGLHFLDISQSNTLTQYPLKFTELQLHFMERSCVTALWIHHSKDAEAEAEPEKSPVWGWTPLKTDWKSVMIHIY